MVTFYSNPLLSPCRGPPPQKKKREREKSRKATGYDGICNLRSLKTLLQDEFHKSGGRILQGWGGAKKLLSCLQRRKDEGDIVYLILIVNILLSSSHKSSPQGYFFTFLSFSSQPFYSSHTGRVFFASPLKQKKLLPRRRTFVVVLVRKSVFFVPDNTFKKDVYLRKATAASSLIFFFDYAASNIQRIRIRITVGENNHAKSFAFIFCEKSLPI